MNFWWKREELNPSLFNYFYTIHFITRLSNSTLSYTGYLELATLSRKKVLIFTRLFPASL
nr:MAG TPA: hypothetical protein [Caudoviricetes sp.]